MKPFVPFGGIAAPLPATNVNTDAIIPSEYLRTLDSDLSRGLFARYRFAADGAELPDFVLNRPPFRDAQILVAGANFGCGSSREAAVWALQSFGIRCVVAPSFADIFHENALRNGLVVATIPDAEASALAEALVANPAEAHIAVDLAGQTLTHGAKRAIAFDIPASWRDALLRGEDEIAVTLRHADEIARHARNATENRPWRDRAFRAGHGAAT